METETQQQDPDVGADQPDQVDVDLDTPPAEPPAGDPPAGGAPEPTEGGERPLTRREAKRQDFRDRLALRKVVEEQQRQNQELTRRLDQALGRMSDVVERSTPPRENPLVAERKKFNERWEKVVARLDKDPSAAEEFRELQFEAGRLAAREEMAEQQRTAPAPVSPLAQSLFAEFPWLHPEHGDAEARVMVNGEAAKLARKEKRDMANPQVRYTTLRQAAAIVARDLEYPLPPSYAAGENGNGNGRQRVAGTSGRAGGGGGAGGGDPFVGMDADIEAAATIMYPNLDKAQAIAKWRATAGKRMQPRK